MVATFDPKSLGKAAPRIEWEDLDDDQVIVKLVHFEQGFDDTQDPPRPMAHLTTEEFGDKRLYLGVTQGKYLVEGLGSDPSRYPGNEVVIERKKVAYAGDDYQKVWLAPVEVWREAGCQFASPKKRASTKASAKRPKRAKGKKARRS